MLRQLLENNLLSFLFTFLPALVYAVIVYMSFKKDTISWKSSFLYFMMGAMSGIAVMTLQWIFPNLHNELFGPDRFVLSYFIMCFIQIALIEEGMKMFFFGLTNSYRTMLPKPGGIMFYCMSVSAGFAVQENLMYVMRYGDDVLLPRAFSAIILHMLTGIMMGYFITLGIYNKKKILYSLIGLIVATIYHGLYDFDIFIRVSPYGFPTGLGIPIQVLLGFGLVTTFLMYLHLRNKHKQFLV